MSREIYSVIDASINRALEGIRVCEDIARFSIRDRKQSARLKELRHRLGKEARRFPWDKLLHSRDIEGDEQKYRDLESEKNRSDLVDVLRANFHRATEAVRTIEELAKLIKISSDNFQKIRFALYDCEKNAVMAVDKTMHMARFYRSLYAIIDSSFTGSSSYSRACLSCIRGGASIIQLRMKGHETREILEAAAELAPLCAEHDVVFIVNDRPDIALSCGARGVHLGQRDMPVPEARKLLPENMIIGISTHSYEEVELALYSKPDYIAVGPLFDTNSKDGSMMHGIGTDILEDIRNITDIPLVGIGGINDTNAAEVIARGCHACAVMGSLYSDPEENSRKIMTAIRERGA